MEANEWRTLSGVRIAKGTSGARVIVTFVDDAGTVIDISAATTRQILMKSAKSGTVKTCTASFVATGSDGQIYYALTSTDLDAIGDWVIQGKVSNVGGLDLCTDSGAFEVFARLA